MALSSIAPKLFRKPQINGGKKAAKLPRLVNVNRRKSPEPHARVVPDLAKAPFGKQKDIILGALSNNGVSNTFILPLQKLVVQYCDWGGSSKGMREFILSDLAVWAKRNPQVEVVVQPTPRKHPFIRGFYDNGLMRAICVKNRESRDILSFANQCRDSFSVPAFKPKKPIFSVSDSVHGIWTPFKDPKLRPESQPQAPRYLYSNDF